MNTKDRWKNRRAMAWISMVAGIAYPMLLWGTDSEQLGEIAIPFYLFVGSVVGAYIGFATADDKWRNYGRFETYRSGGTSRSDAGYSGDQIVPDYTAPPSYYDHSRRVRGSGEESF